MRWDVPKQSSRNRCEQAVVWEIGCQREQAKEDEPCTDLCRLDQYVSRNKSGDKDANNEYGERCHSPVGISPFVEAAKVLASGF
jgi:hypothetical protein